MLCRLLYVGVHLITRPICPILSEKFGYFRTNESKHSKVNQPLHINIFQRCSIIAVVTHKAAFDAGEVERLVILVVVILGAEVFIPVAGHIHLEESYKVFEEFETVLSQFIAKLATGDDDAPVGVVAYAFAVLPEADINIQTSLVNTDADAICIPHNTARISVTISLT